RPGPLRTGCGRQSRRAEAFPAVSHERFRDEFVELARISSVSKREGNVAKRLTTILEDMGASVQVDDAGETIGSDTGNLLARFAGTAPDVAPFLLCAHMDTVPPADHVRPVVDGDIIRSDGTTVLGGDDKAGIVAILAAGRLLGGGQDPPRAVHRPLAYFREGGLGG